MSKDFKNTPSDESKASTALRSSSLSDTFEKLEHTRKALHTLKQTSHFVYGVKNILFNFDEEVDEQLSKVSHVYLQLLRRKAELLDKMQDLEKNNDDQEQIQRVKNNMYFIDIAIKEERNKITPIITEKLLKLFTNAFDFLINHLDDQRLEELKINLTQKDIAQMLYEHIESYESIYVLGKTIQFTLAPKIKELASQKGDKILNNITDVLTFGRPYLDHIKPRKRIPTMSGLGEEESEEQRKSKTPTIAPKPFIPQTEAEIRAEAEIKFGLKNFTNNKVPEFKEYDGEESAVVTATTKTQTLMYPGVMPKPQGGITPPELSDEEKEIQENTDRISQEISILPKAKLPDLSGLFNVPEEKIVKEEIGDLTIQTNVLIESLVSEQTPDKLNLQEVSNTEVIKVDQPEEVNISKQNTDINSMANEKAVQQSNKQNLMPSERLIQKFSNHLDSIIINTNIIEDIEQVEKINTIEQQTEQPINLPETHIQGGIGVGSFWNKAKAKAKKHWKGLMMAGGLFLGGLALHGASQQNTQEQKITDNSTENSIKKNIDNTNKIAPKIVENKDIITMQDDKDIIPVEKIQREERQFAAVIKTSKSPIVQKIINEGEFILSGASVIDTMIGSFRGLANNQQNKQLDQLQSQINFALSVFYNEHFGTPERMKESMQDLKMRNLYRTVKFAQRKGWLNKSLTKSEYPKSYEFAKQILEDSSDLQIDISESQTEAIQNFSKGNMFQAKFAGNNIKVKKDNGKYHIIQELVFDIFEDKDISSHFDKILASVDSSVIQENNINPVHSDNSIEDNRMGQLEKTNKSINAEGGSKLSQFSTVDIDSIDSNWDSIFAKHQVNQELNDIDAEWNNIFAQYENNRTHQHLERVASGQIARIKEIEEIDAGWDFIDIKQEIRSKLNQVALKSDLDKELEEIDAGWDLA